MTTAAIYEADGRITTVRSGDEVSVKIDAEASGKDYILTDVDVDFERHYVDVSTKEIKEYPEQPREDYVFDFSSKNWGFGLALSKESKWREIKQSRDTQEYGGFTYDSNTFDSNEVAQQRIQNAMLLATQDSSVTMDWTLANNNTVSLNAAQIIELGKALAHHVNTAHKKAQTLRVQVNAASSKSDIDAISWSE
tara:strand:- start:1152 stop:1733 length:582 start_codon:yes stop_codon:yes gene_type:complete